MLDRGPGVSLADLGCSLVLVDHSAEDWVASDGRVERGHRGWVVEWWVLVEALVPTVVVEVPKQIRRDGEGVALVGRSIAGALLAELRTNRSA